jgi:hypothetical protein
MADGDPIILGGFHDANGTTRVTHHAGLSSAFLVESDSGVGLDGRSKAAGTGVLGWSDSGAGVVGRSDHGHAGVYGWSDDTGSAGVFGWSDRVATFGTRGHSRDGVGVYGTTRDGNAVIGESSGGGDAVWGSARGGVGVHGYSEESEGVRGISLYREGVVGTAWGSRAGVRAISSKGAGLVASSTSGNAAEFFGPVVVVGPLVAAGPFKAAAVPHPDGTHRLTYCMESPESWFEDFGRARLSRGRAEVLLDPDFAALVRTEDFHVFLTPEGETAGLYVADRNESGFEVREQRGGDGDVPFSYRAVARRRDVDTGRLAAFELPEIPPEPEPVEPAERLELPDVPDLPPEWQPRRDEPEAADS